MSTRCQIGFYPEKPEAKNLDQHEALIYRHSDGYPGKADGSEYGVLTDLVPFLIKFHKNRGLSDAEYAGARTLQHLTNEYDKQTAELPAIDVYSPGFDQPHEKWHLSETIHLLT